MTRLAEVCRMYTVHSPWSTPARRTSSAMSAVTSCKPCPGVRTLNCLTIGARFERRDGGECFSFQELEERAAGRRDVIDIARDAELVDRRHGIAAARDRERFGASDGARERLGAAREGVVLEDADRPVPHDGARALEGMRERERRLRADVEDHVVRGPP